MNIFEYKKYITEIFYNNPTLENSHEISRINKLILKLGKEDQFD